MMTEKQIEALNIRRGGDGGDIALTCPCGEVVELSPDETTECPKCRRVYSARSELTLHVHVDRRFITTVTL